MRSASRAARKLPGPVPVRKDAQPPRGMRRAAWPAAVLFLAALSACTLDSPYVRVRVEMPTVPAVKVDDYREIVVAGFHVAAPAEGVDLDADLSAFFEAELRARTGAQVARRRIVPEDAARLKEEEFWKRASGESGKTLFLSGTAVLEEESRKALLEKARRHDEDPFSTDKVWDERKVFTLKTTLMLIDGPSGRPVFEKEYKETATYADVRQPAPFALFDVMQRLKLKFFRAAFGGNRIQERYLLYR